MMAKEMSDSLTTIRDSDIRRVLRQQLLNQYRDEPDTLVIDELALCQGNSRVDVAVINGSLNGYEIKSERDTLERLAGQQENYNKTFDTVTIVTSGLHLLKVLERVPTWWGVTEASLEAGRVRLNIIRLPEQNLYVDPLALSQFLWRNEVLEELTKRGIHRGLVNKPRRFLWKKLAESLSMDEISSIVRHRLKTRTEWRVE